MGQQGWHTDTRACTEPAPDGICQREPGAVWVTVLPMQDLALPHPQASPKPLILVLLPTQEQYDPVKSLFRAQQTLQLCSTLH